MNIVAVIPMRDQLSLTIDLVAQLREQGDVDEIVVCDNGSTQVETTDWLHDAVAEDLSVLWCDSTDGIHVMWNRAVDYVLEEHGPCRIAFLNNDIRIGYRFLRRLSRAMQDYPVFRAVCGNYDGREGYGVEVTRDICARRYDGSGGFAGFAFMVSPIVFEEGYRFPEDQDWWFGDMDLITRIYYDGWKAGICLDAEVEHIDGGGKTAGDPEWSDPRWAEMKVRDREVYEERWRKIRLSDQLAKEDDGLRPWYLREGVRE